MNQSMKASIEDFFIQTGRDATICAQLVEIYDPLVAFLEDQSDKDLYIVDLKSEIKDREEDITDLTNELDDLKEEIKRLKKS